MRISLLLSVVFAAVLAAAGPAFADDWLVIKLRGGGHGRALCGRGGGGGGAGGRVAGGCGGVEGGATNRSPAVRGGQPAGGGRSSDIVLRGSGLLPAFYPPKGTVSKQGMPPPAV